MLMSALRQILNMSPALLIDNNIFNSPFGTASDHSSRSKPTPSFSKMMQKALKNKTHNLLEPHHTIVILCNRKKNDGLVIFTHTHIATAWLCYFWHLDFFFFLSQLFIGVLSQNLSHPKSQPQNNTQYSKKCFYFSVKYDSP